MGGEQGSLSLQGKEFIWEPLVARVQRKCGQSFSGSRWAWGGEKMGPRKCPGGVGPLIPLHPLTLLGGGRAFPPLPFPLPPRPVLLAGVSGRPEALTCAFTRLEMGAVSQEMGL